MTGAILRELVIHWADLYGLRLSEADGSYRGIVEGVCINVSTNDVAIVAQFFSPSTSLVSEIATDFKGFTNLASFGVPISTLRCAFGSSKDNQGSCILELSVGQIRALDPMMFEQIPSLIVRDFQSLGAGSQSLMCSMCSAPAPTQLICDRNEFHTICNDCFVKLHEEAVHSPDTPYEGDPVAWSRAIPALVVSTVVLGCMWGSIQQPTIKIPFMALIVFPFAGVFVNAWFNVRAACGTSPMLVRAIAVSSLLAILIGNVIGYGAALADNGVEATWPDVIQAYFQLHLPNQWEAEAIFFVGGIAGIYFALGGMQPSTKQEILRRL